MPSLWILPLIAGSLCLLSYLFRSFTSPKAIPGPPGWPIVGNLLSLPKDLLFLRLEEWAKQYGSIFYISIGTQPAIVLNNAKVAADLLDRMSAVTSDRPPMIKANEFYIRNMDFALLNRGELWRACRRASHANLNLRVVAGFHALQEEEAAYMVLQLLHNAGTNEKPISEHTHRFSGSTIYRALYGGSIIRLDGPDPSKPQEELVQELMLAMNPSTSIVDLMPFLRPIIARSKFLRRHADDFYNRAYEELMSAFRAASQNNASSIRQIARDFDENGEQYGLSRTMAIFTVGALFMAAQETTHTALLWFVLSMLLHPRVVQEAQAQLDSVVGNRPPSFADREQLPLIEAIMKEVLRWRPAVPLSLIHVASEDFEYQGYVIRKGTQIIDNIWAQNKDPSLYVNPETFDPSRFLDEKGQLKASTPDTHGDLLAFGHGRRVCPGKDFAFNSMWIATASLLWAFRFDKAIGEDGKEMCPDPSSFCDFFVSVQPAPYQVELVPRRDDLEEKLHGVLGKSL